MLWALCMRNNVQCTFYIMFCKLMQFNIIFKTIFEYIRKKFRFVHTDTFCEHRKKLRASPRVHLVINDLKSTTNKFDVVMYADYPTLVSTPYGCLVKLKYSITIHFIRDLSRHSISG